MPLETDTERIQFGKIYVYLTYGILRLAVDGKLRLKKRVSEKDVIERRFQRESLHGVRLLLWYLDFLLRFGNDEYAMPSVGIWDYKLGDTIHTYRDYYFEGIKTNIFSVGQFCDGGLEVAFSQPSCLIRNYDLVDLLKEGLYTSVPKTVSGAFRTHQHYELLLPNSTENCELTALYSLRR
ncbi:hypothetical protein Tco_0087816 [Tanacetum coccineum]